MQTSFLVLHGHVQNGANPVDSTQLCTCIHETGVSRITPSIDKLGFSSAKLLVALLACKAACAPHFAIVQPLPLEACLCQFLKEMQMLLRLSNVCQMANLHGYAFVYQIQSGVDAAPVGAHISVPKRHILLSVWSYTLSKDTRWYRTESCE